MAVYNINSLLLKQGQEIAGVHVSVKKGEQHDRSATITDIPLESGESIRDHVILAPGKLSMNFECVNTDTQSAQTSFDNFMSLMDSRDILEVITDFCTYPNMVLTSVSISENAPIKNAFVGTCTFEEANYVVLTEIGRENVKSSTSSSVDNSKSMSVKTERGSVNDLNQESEDNTTLLGAIAEAFE